MQGLVVVCLIVEKIWNVNLNSMCFKKSMKQNIGQCTCQVRRSGRDVMQGMMFAVEL